MRFKRLSRLVPVARPKALRVRASAARRPGAGLIRHVAILNTPIFIWFLSTIAAGTIGTLYANVSACRVAEANDQRRIQMLLLELSKRVENARDESDLAPPDQKVAVAENFAKPDIGYAFLDFKGRSSEEIQSNLVYLLKRWGVLEKDVTWDEIPDRIKADAYGAYELDLAHNLLTPERKNVYIYNYLYKVKDLKRAVVQASYAGSQAQALREEPEITTLFNEAERAAAVATEIANSTLLPSSTCRPSLYAPF